MFEKLKKAIFEKYAKNEQKWFFLTAFDKDANVLASKWIFQTDANLDKWIESIYLKYIDKDSKIKKNMVLLCADIVIQVIEITNADDLFKLSPKHFWVFMITLDGDKSWVLLPNTEWVMDMKQSLYMIQQKELLGNNVKIYVFKTERFEILL